MQRAKKSTDYVLPAEVCVMINVIASSKPRATALSMDTGDVSETFFVSFFATLQYIFKY